MQTRDKRLALVTGANKGIGFEICRQLAHKGLRIVLTSHDARKGIKAQKILAQQNLDVLFHEVDVTDRRSVGTLARYVQKQHGEVDALVSNPRMLMDSSATEVLAETKS